MNLYTLFTEAVAQVARRDAELLLAHALGQPRTFVLAHPEYEVGAGAASAFRALVARRAAGEPLQYLTGVQEFFGLALRVTPAVLIPRPETEHLVEAVLAWAEGRAAPLRILDVGTGSGAIALALAMHLPQSAIVASDISAEALALARENARAHGLEERVRFVESDLLAQVEVAESFDVVVSNPPYIPAGDAATMQREVVEHEPHAALFAGPDGLAIYRRLIPQAHAALRPGGLLALEFGFGQAAELTELLRGWRNVRVFDDYAGIERVVLAERA